MPRTASHMQSTVQFDIFWTRSGTSLSLQQPVIIARGGAASRRTFQPSYTLNRVTAQTGDRLSQVDCLSV